MKKILSLGQDQITSGLSKGKHNQKSGIWYSAPGLNPFINDDDLIGTIAVSSAPTDITGAVVVDTPIAATSQATSSTEGTMYILGDEGHLYTVDLNGNNAPVDQRSATPITSPANGLAILSTTSYADLASDSDTLALYHLNGTDGTAPKLDNAQGDASWDLTEGAGNPTSTTGRDDTTADGAYAFTSAGNQYLTAGDTAFPTSDFTVDFWFKYPDCGDEKGMVTKAPYENTSPRSNGSFSIFKNGRSGIVARVFLDGDTNTAISTTVLPSNDVWHHLALVFKAGTYLKLYIDGVLDSEVTTSVVASVHNSGADFTIGAFNTERATGNWTFNGSIDEVRVSNIVRTPQEILAQTRSRGLYYWQEAQIGRWDGGGAYPTNWTDGVFTGLQNTPYHPVHSLFDNVFYGNKFYVGYLYLSGTSVLNNATALDLPVDMTVTCLQDDGQNLVIGATKNLGSSTIFSESKVYFWDTNSNSWQKEYSIPSPTINALGKIGTTLYALCGKDLYAFNFSTPPVLVRSVGENDMPQFAQSQAIDTLGEGIIWGGVGTLQSFGKLSPEAKNAFWEPFTGVADTVSMIFTDAKSDTMFVGTSTPKLWRYNTATNGYNAETLQTIFFDLKARYKVQQLEFIMPSGQTSGDITGVTLVTPTGTMACTSVSFSNQGDVDYVKVTPTSAIETQTLSIQLTLSGGAPTIGRIDIWGEPVNHQ